MPCHINTLSTKIEPMAISDIDKIFSIELLAHTHPWSKKTFLSNFGKRYFNHVLSYDNEILGYFVASSVAGEATLMNISVDPKLQGNGLGRLLLEYLIEFSIKNNEEEIWLEVRTSNSSALALYSNLGFVIVDTRKDYYPSDNGREDAIIMCLKLPLLEME